MRAIMTINKSCKCNCPHCYYKWRGSYYSDPNLLHAALPFFDEIAIGINEGSSSLEVSLLKEAVKQGKDIIITSVLSDSLMNCGVDTLNNVSLISISYDEYRMIPHPRVVETFNSLNTIKVLNILNTRAIDNSLSKSIDNIMKEVKFDYIYLLCEKHDVNPYSSECGFKIDEKVIENYSNVYWSLMRLVSIPIMMDECVYNIVTKGKPNCIGKWVDISSDGSIRYCPYSGTPDYFIKDPHNAANDNIDFDSIYKNIPQLVKCRS
jgi:hypothetical protein